MAPRGTTLRNVRVSDELWTAAQAVAKVREENASDVMRDALDLYVRQHRGVMPAAARRYLNMPLAPRPK